MKDSTKIAIFVFSGLFLAVAFAVLAGCFMLIFDAIIKSQLIIDEDGAIYDPWVEPETPLYLKLYMFDVTNAYEIQNYGAKPELKEYGPYVYEEYLKKNNVNFYESESAVEYVSSKTYFFNREMSSGEETDEFTILNLPMAMLASVGFDNENVTRIWDKYEELTDLFQVHSVGDFFFYGYDLPVFTINLPNQPPKNMTLYEIIDAISDEKPPELLKDNKFGLFYWSNGTEGSTFKINTGEDDIDEYTQLIEYNGKTELDYWNTSYCNMINGTDGTFFHPHVEREETLYIFVGELCRSLYSVYEKDVKEFDELTTLKFIIPESVLADPNTDPENACYCTKVYEEDEKCLGAGMINLAPCAGGIPLVLSTPHFYLGDQEEIDKLVGIEPVKDLHETFFNIEPTVGATVNGAKRMQVNFPLRKYGQLSTFQNVPDVVLPIFWLDEGASLNKDDAKAFDNILTIPFIVVYTVCSLLMVVGIVLVILGVRKKQVLNNFDENTSRKDSDRAPSTPPSKK